MTMKFIICHLLFGRTLFWEKKIHKKGKTSLQLGQQRKKALHASTDHRQSKVTVFVDNDGTDDTPLWTAVLTYISYAVMALAGITHDLLSYLNLKKCFGHQDYCKDFVPLYRSFESFFTRNLYIRAKHIFERPVRSRPGIYIDVEERIRENYNWTLKRSDNVIKALNMGSYNYLGFSSDNQTVTDQVIRTIDHHGHAIGLSTRELGRHTVQSTLERRVADFVGKEDSVTFGMGFATNSCNIATLISKGCLVLSDEFNHSSLVIGVRISGATVKIFPHDDMVALERIIRDSIVNGRPKSHRPWRKIMIIVEGVYSMEGTMCNLPELITLKKRYKLYLYVDEAHSIGALGPRGRGVADYFSCDPRDIDVLMGTFTKSFASAGGYIAGDKRTVDHIRSYSHACTYASSMSPAICEQIIAAIDVIEGKICPGEGLKRINNLSWNARYLRRKLKNAGYIVYGDANSPVVPILTYLPAKIRYLTEQFLEHGVAVVGVGFPATRLVESRLRICVSSGHTKENIDMFLQALEKINQITKIKYKSV